MEQMKATQDLSELTADAWCAVATHLDAEPAIRGVAAVLARCVKFSRLVVQEVALDRSAASVARVEVVAGRDGLSANGRYAPSTLESAQVAELSGWLQAGQGYEGPPDQAPGRLTAGVEAAAALALPFPVEDAVAGVLVLLSGPAAPLETCAMACAGAVLEPIRAALENSRRLMRLEQERTEAEARCEVLSTQRGGDTARSPGESIIGAETGLRVVMQQVSLVARSDAPVLILGETGSGKEVIARRLHQLSTRADQPFLRVNCGAIPSELVDSELFGHERGSFTGATAQRLGWFERANGGTLFLDEVGELSLDAQVRLLRIVQDGSFQRVGGERALSVDVRIVTATHRDLKAMVTERLFRDDLWYRISVFPIAIPPLRNRREDIPALAAHFALRAARRFGIRSRLPTPEDEILLMHYDWPGNVRELASVMERAALLGEGRALAIAPALGTTSLTQARARTEPATEGGRFPTLDEVAAGHIRAALKRTRGQVEGARGAALLLGINPHTLRARMRRLGVDWRHYRDHAS